MNESMWYAHAVARKKIKGTRGGWRPGSGRKPEFEDRVLRSVSFERDDVERLEAIAEHEGVSLAEIVRRAVSAFLSRRRGRA